MKSTMTLNFGTNKIYYGYMGNQLLKHNLPQGTMTLLVASADSKNKQGRKWHTHGFCNIYCKACDCLMVVPNAENLIEKQKQWTCPSCGKTHKIDNICLADRENSLMPCNMTLNLYEKKETIELVIKYNGVVMGNNVYKDFKIYGEVKEVFSFDTNNHEAVWRKFIGKELEEVVKIGYHTDIKDLFEKSALYWLNSTYKSVEQKSFCEMLKILREKINARMKAQGLSARKLYVNGSNKYKAVDNVLMIAHQVRFWDSKDNVNVYGNGIDKLENWLINNKVDTYIERKVESVMKEGNDYVSALIMALELPNTKKVRKHISIENAHLLQTAYSVKGAETFLFDNFKKWIDEAKTQKVRYCYEKPVLDKFAKMKEVCDFMKAFIDYYPQVPIEKMFNLALERNGRDILHLWQQADKNSKETFRENVPRFKELHDYLSVLVAKQADRDLDFDIPEHIVRRMEMNLNNTNYAVLQKFSQVKQASLDLKNCASGYRNRINENLQLVLMSDDKGKPIALLEIKESKIIQAKLFANKSVCYEEKVNQAVIEFAQKAKLAIDTKDVDVQIDRSSIFKVA